MNTCLDAEPEPAAKSTRGCLSGNVISLQLGDLVNKKSSRCNCKDCLQIHRRRKAYNKNAMPCTFGIPEIHLHQRRVGVTSRCQVEVITMCKYHILFGNDTPNIHFPDHVRREEM
jgi:hypothetical protein